MTSSSLPSPCFVQHQPVKFQPSKIEAKKHQHQRWCKVCKIIFAGEKELFQHRRQQHETCPYDGCKFNALAQIISEHIQKVHLKPKTLINIHLSPDDIDIAKWREERRKRYPTTSNVMLRQQSQEVKFQRGERLESSSKSRFGDQLQLRKPNKRHTKFNHQRDERNSNRPNQNNKRASSVPFRKPINTLRLISDGSSSEEEVRKTPIFRGTSQMKHHYHRVETIVKENTALSVLGIYGSDSENESVVETQYEEETNGVSKEETNGVSEDENPEPPEEIPFFQQSEELSQISETCSLHKQQRKRKPDALASNRDQKVKRKGGLDFSKLKRSSANPLLNKLLDSDIRHERNLLMQCVNFVVKSNFFGIGRCGEGKNDAQIEETVLELILA